MNRSDLTLAVAGYLGLSKAEADRAVVTVLDTIKGAVANGERVELIGFGSFEIKYAKARVGRNPQNGEPIQIAAKKSVRFKSGSKFNAAL